MQETAYLSARQIAEDIRTGRRKSRDVLEAMLARIERVDPPYNTVIAIDAECARAAADAADRAVAAGETLRPLHGVCMTVKETFDVAGMRTTYCTERLAQHRPEHDAVPIARLKQAGAVIVGKTNTSEWASDNQSFNELFGTSNNPYDPARTVGGSSGGSAGALALGLTPLELGSDLGGSIRTPAAYCGVVGHKSSYEVIPLHGLNPPPGMLGSADITCVGPMARDCHDAELMLSIMAGPSAWDAVAYRLELPPARRTRTRDYRVALWLDAPDCPVSRDVAAGLRAAADALANAGARVEQARPAIEFAEARRLYLQLVSGVNSRFFTDDALERLREKAKHDETLASLHGGPAQLHRDWLSASAQRRRMRQKWSDFFCDWDVILMPVAPDVAFPHNHQGRLHRRTVTIDGVVRSYNDLFVWAGVVGLAYLPSTSVPVGLSPSGMPVGVQVVGPFLEDRTTLDLGGRLMELTGGFRPPSRLPPRQAL